LTDTETIRVSQPSGGFAIIPAMQLGWNEIKRRAVEFSREWSGETREHAEAKSFWDAFFNVFGIPRRSVATFEEPVRKLGGQYGFIDLFWKGRLLVEHKSRGQSLERAESQAFGYAQALAGEGRADEMPQYIIVTDFDRLALYDLEPEDGETPNAQRPTLNARRTEIRVADLHRHIKLFGFIPGYKVRSFAKEDPINIKAAEVMAKLHDAMRAGGYEGHPLERFLVRVLFCLFADDTGIFEPGVFAEYVENGTRQDGSDLGPLLARFFQTLDTPQERRQTGLDERLANLPYVNGALFAESLPLAEMNAAMRGALLACMRFDWSRISPAVFGSLFQSVMQPEERRQLGAHYTSERDILKVVHALFLDGLRAEFEAARRDRRKLDALHRRIGALRFFDPACGCGNFLVIAYRELRLLENEILDALHGGQQALDIAQLARVDVDAFTGIEIEEWPARIAETALWLMDHQMNLLLAERFGQYFTRLPLRKAAKIVHGNALRLDWRGFVNPAEISYILGNPPFVGAKYQSAEQRADMAAAAKGVKNAGLLDYVAGWYFKAADFIQGTDIRVGFVSTNSITQGEQPGILWHALFAKGLKINFAYRTFPWVSEAKGKAHVHVVIIGFSRTINGNKRIYDESNVAADAKNISPYLTEGPDTAIVNRMRPLSSVPEIGIGNKPIDGGNYLFTPEEKAAFLALEPGAVPWFSRWIGAEEFINGIERWCLLLKDCPPNELKRMPEVLKRVEAVRKLRLASKSEATRKLADMPTRFHVENFPDDPYLVIPSVSSEKRKYIPVGFLPPSVIASNLVLIIPNAKLYHFGVLTSAMHMAWVRQVCGRLKSDYRYSGKLAYNNFPWPQLDTSGYGFCISPYTPMYAREAAARTYWSSYHDEDDLHLPDPPRRAPESPFTGDAKKIEVVEDAARAVLDARADFPDEPLATLYDPLAMPARLVKAHAALDRAVDRCYRAAPFTSDRQRVEFLFALYASLTTPLLPVAKKKRKNT
jgi:hypothetical protein